MRGTFLIIVAIAIFPVAEPASAQDEADTEAVVRVVADTVRAFFDAIANYDYQRLRDMTSDGYVLIENGPVWTLDSLTAMMQHFEPQGATITYDFLNMDANVRGSVAWVVYENNGVMSVGSQQQDFNWTESAVLTREPDGWKIALLHSTLNEPHSNEHRD